MEQKPFWILLFNCKSLKNEMNIFHQQVRNQIKDGGITYAKHNPVYFTYLPKM
jgi:hypothetical protein